MDGNIHSIETFGSLDGPGIRFVIFVQGCAMRCLFCHNPDTWKLEGGTKRSPDSLIEQALRYRPYWGDEGGTTVSGGEPLLQIDFLLELFQKAKAHGISTCIDTAGQPFRSSGPWFDRFQELMKVTDLLLMDIKHINPDMHRKLTSHPNDNIIAMFRYLDEIHKPIWIRHVLLPGYTDNDEYLRQTRAFIDTLHNVKHIDVLPFHKMGEFKWKELGYDYKLWDTKSPTQERVQNAIRILKAGPQQ